MKIEYWPDRGDEAFALIADKPGDEELLMRFLNLAPRCSLRAVTWQYEAVSKKPLEKAVSRVDLRLVDKGCFEPKDIDNQPAAKGNG